MRFRRVEYPVTAAEAVTEPASPAVPWWNRRGTWATGWLLAALWAAAFPVVSSLETHRLWGTSAALGYAAAAAVSYVRPGPRARRAAVTVALVGAVVAPLLFLVLTGRAQSEVDVIERSGRLLLEQGTPYLPHPDKVTDYTPYLPAMALLGIPKALTGDHSWAARLLGDARIWCAAVFVLCLHTGRLMLRRNSATAPRTGRRERIPYGTAVAVMIASPVVALPLCVSGVDLPLTGLCCLALAIAARGRPAAAGLVLAVVCSLKWTAWPAIAVAMALLGCVAGRRAAVRCAGTVAAGATLLIVPGALLSPAAMVEQVLAFPTGRGDLPTPAASPLPGRLLADLGPAGWYAAVGLLIFGALAVAVSLVQRPPAHLRAAADRLAIGLIVAFTLAPAGRFGYLALPIVLMVWARQADPREPVPSLLVRGARPGRAAPVVPSRGPYAPAGTGGKR
ncbi:glycosyltransferase 87 family protein [Streptomyces sp. NBC_00259]|uniref:glycosyltransferase 87 family protein n=1 Tax=Streptomyces sp. NBC_00259 TaxID=2903643 RepID=UPI002E2E3FED|nr:glycosyltransferase 87 family protein [Streptomyces sp. NBC_00259]